MLNPNDHPVRDAFLRLALLIVWYGAAAIVCLVALGYLLVFAGSTGERLTTALGGSFTAKAAGYIFAYGILLGIAVGTGLAIGFAYAVFMKRWPNSPVARLVKWVKTSPSDS